MASTADASPRLPTPTPTLSALELANSQHLAQEHQQNVSNASQKIENARIAYLNATTWLKEVIKKNRHVESSVAATAVLELYSQMPWDAKIQNFFDSDLTFQALQNITSKLCSYLALAFR